jgi:hypothetical protein
MGGTWDFEGQAELTKSKIEAFLSRAVTHFDICSHGNFDEAKWARTKQFLLHTGAKFIHGGELSWGNSYPDHSYWDKCRIKLKDLHATPGLEDVIVEGFIAEHIASNADKTLIPDWLWTYMEKEGITNTRTPSSNDTGDKHYFHYENFFEKDWKMIDHWGKGRSVPDIRQTETKLYYRYLLKEYIDAGFESIWFGQLWLTAQADSGCAALNEICQFAKKYAAKHGRRHAILLCSHTDGHYHKGRQLMDYCAFPCRVRYSDKYPHGMEIKTSPKECPFINLKRVLDNKADLPVLLEVDNYACSPRSNFIGGDDGGFDEITGFAYKEPWQRRMFLEQYYWELRTVPNIHGNKRVFLSMPGRRGICIPTCTGCEQSKNPKLPYPRNRYSPYREHCGDEDTIARIFRSRGPSMTTTQPK